MALSKQPPSQIFVLGQSETNVQPADHDVPTHSKENEGVKDETQDRREEHLGWATVCLSPGPDPHSLRLKTEHGFTHDLVNHTTDWRKQDGKRYQNPCSAQN